MIRLNIYAAALLILGSAHSAHAQIAINGRVTNEQNQALNAVDLEIQDSTGIVQLRAITDSLGEFRMRVPASVSPRTLFVSARVIGYAPIQRSPIQIGKFESILLVVKLAIEPTALAPINVVARSTYRRSVLDEYYDRADYVNRTGLGKILGNDELRLTPGLNMRQVLTMRGGLRFTTLNSGGVAYTTPVLNDECEPAVFMNRMRVDPGDLEDIDPSLLEGVEVYKSFSLVPIDYAIAAENCGAILMWSTRIDRTWKRFKWKRIVMNLFGLAGFGGLMWLIQSATR
jgi:hypothetical protein